MARRSIALPGVPAARHLSPAVAANGMLYLSGQTAGEVEGFEAQTRAVLEKIGRVLRAAGADYRDVVRCGVYLTDITNWQKMHEVYVQFFTADPPARSTIECRLAGPTILIEIDCVAVLPEGVA